MIDIHVNQHNPITPEIQALRERIDHGKPVWLADKRLVRILRLRLVSDPGYPLWDLSYCYGQLADGTEVRVILPRAQFAKRHLNRDLIAMCKEAGRFGKALDIFNAVSWIN